MKMKIISAALLATLSYSAIAADSHVGAMFNVQIMKDEKVVTQVSIAALHGQSTPVGITTITACKAYAARDIDGKVELKAGNSETGLLVMLTPDIAKSSQINADVQIDSISKLSPDCISALSADIPEMSNIHFAQKVEFIDGKPVSMQSGKYTIKVSASKY